ncbi:unnamed protein product [Prorocentrum cordatum]|nr:unnamed protein product [Polarella glacialis]
MQKSGEASDAGSGGGDAGDFCGFVNGRAKDSQLYVGVSSMASVCAGICQLAGVDVLSRTRVADVQFQSASKSWDLACQSEGGDGGADPHMFGFDAVVFAVHNPAFGAAAVQRLAAEARDEEIRARLSRLAAALQDLRDTQKGPLLPLRARFPAGSLSAQVPFDAATCPTSPDIQFICRHGSLPPGDATGEEMWTAVPTTRLSRELLQRGLDERGQCEELHQRLSGLLGSFFRDGGGGMPAPTRLSVKRWGAGLTLRPLGLREPCVGLEPWRLGICGDFLQAAPGGGPLEAAALSGYQMGDRVASWFAA